MRRWVLIGLLAWACDDGGGADLADAEPDPPQGDCGVAEPTDAGSRCGEDPADEGVAPGIEGPSDGLWHMGMQFVDAGGITLAFQAEFNDGGPGLIGRFALRVIANDGSLSEPITVLTAIPVDAEGRFEILLDGAVLPADYSPTNDDLMVTLTLSGQTRDAFFCGDIRGTVDSLNLPIEMSTFAGVPWPSDETPTNCDWTPGATNVATIGTDERPATVQLPTAHDPSMDWPVIMVLHGYSTTGETQAGYFGLPARLEDGGYLLIVPDGTLDDTDQQYWNALPGCCGGGDPEGPDDVAYLRSLFDQVVADLGGDPRRLYVWGHSNGAFMAHKMICDAGDLVAGAVALAGGTYNDFADCADNGPIALLNAHGTADSTIPAMGRPDGENAFPSAEGTASRWAERNQCTRPQSVDPIDLMDDPAGTETRVTAWEGCADGAEVVLWEHIDGAHIPILAPAWSDRAVEFLLRQHKP